MNTGNTSPQFPNFPTTFPLGSDDLSPDEKAVEEEFLASVQGNILKGHGRDNARLVFFRFGPDREKSRELLRNAVDDRWVHSARDQRNLALEYKSPKTAKFAEFYGLDKTAELVDRKERVSGLLFSSLGLTTAGLAAVGCVDDKGNSPPRADFRPNTWPESFWTGMKQGMDHKRVPPGQEKLTQHWQEDPYTVAPDRAIHGMFLLACDDPCQLEGHYSRLESWLVDARHGAQLVHIEKGTTWRRDKYERVNYEPFGFMDGISQPLFFAKDRKSAGEWEWVDLKLADVFITPEKSAIHAGASFIAFVKFEQNVAAFHQHEKLILNRINDATKAEHAPAFAVGRLRGGCPLHQAWGPDRPANPDLNSFDYLAEHRPATTGCPFHAHIRKMNPRMDDRDGHAGRDTIIRAQPVRRGMIYGDTGALLRASQDRGPWPAKNVGLLFLAYMADVGRQFELLHNDWAMDPNFPAPGNGETDGILYPGTADWGWRGSTMPKTEPLVKRLGGHYLYVPSLPWLRSGGGLSAP